MEFEFNFTDGSYAVLFQFGRHKCYIVDSFLAVIDRCREIRSEHKSVYRHIVYTDADIAPRLVLDIEKDRGSPETVLVNSLADDPDPAFIVELRSLIIRFRIHTVDRRCLDRDTICIKDLVIAVCIICMEVDLDTTDRIDPRCLQFRTGKIDHIIGLLAGSDFRSKQIIDHIIVDDQCVASNHDVLLGVILYKDLDPVAPDVVSDVVQCRDLNPVLLDQHLLFNGNIPLTAVLCSSICLRIRSLLHIRSFLLIRSRLSGSSRIAGFIFRLHNILRRRRSRRAASRQQRSSCTYTHNSNNQPGSKTHK